MTFLWVWLQLSWPIAGPITLTGSYGEIRGLTFHTGIDISVGEKIGEVPVLAAGEGYVYRIRVSHTGFGRVLYVRHPNGLTTVYGHLSHFASRGENLIRALQVAQRRFEVEKYLRPEEWPVRKGDTIGWAGNSGYSFGPHLHFEVRTTGDKPLCPLRYLPAYPDTEPPVFFRVVVQPLSPTTRIDQWGETKRLRFRQVQKSATERLYRCMDTVTIAGPVGIAYTAGDRMGGGSAWLGLASISLFTAEGKLLYQARWETLDFDWRKFLRWHLDYPSQQIYRIGLARLYEPPQSATPWTRGKGEIAIEPGQVASYLVVAEDFAGNQARVEIVFRGEAPSAQVAPRRPSLPRRTWSIEEGFLLAREPIRTAWGDTVSPSKPLRLEGRIPDTLWSLRGGAEPTHLRACLTPGYEYRLPIAEGCTLLLWRETLQDTLYCQVRPTSSPWGEGFFIGDPLVPIRSPAELRWQIPAALPHKTKVYPVYRAEGSGTWSPVIGVQREGLIWRIPVRSWGEYVLMIDTFPPQIQALRPAGPYYLVVVRDLGSGVLPYAIQVQSAQGSVFPEYYEPQQILYLPRTAGRVFHITAQDRVGNRTEKTVRF